VRIGKCNDVGEMVESANHAQQIVTIQTEQPVEKYDILRKWIGGFNEID